ncbi:MAG: two-component system chemotaxis response regulator CheY [Candidatus Krumholzibacteriia bacterium]|jgi:two-component system chemotaxis response regulator CheY
MPRRHILSSTVLIADDSAFMREILRDICTDMNLVVAGEASDGAEAVESYEKFMPDLVLLDLDMPNMDGTEALQHIMAMDSEAKVVMISALGQKVQVLTAIRCGAQDFLIKPFDQDCVTKTLTDTLVHVSSN